MTDKPVTLPGEAEPVEPVSREEQIQQFFGIEAGDSTVLLSGKIIAGFYSDPELVTDSITKTTIQIYQAREEGNLELAEYLSEERLRTRVLHEIAMVFGREAIEGYSVGGKLIEPGYIREEFITRILSGVIVDSQELVSQAKSGKSTRLQTQIRLGGKPVIVKEYRTLGVSKDEIRSKSNVWDQTDIHVEALMKASERIVRLINEHLLEYPEYGVQMVAVDSNTLAQIFGVRKRNSKVSDLVMVDSGADASKIAFELTKQVTAYFDQVKRAIIMSRAETAIGNAKSGFAEAGEQAVTAVKSLAGRIGRRGNSRG